MFSSAYKYAHTEDVIIIAHKEEKMNRLKETGIALMALAAPGCMSGGYVSVRAGVDSPVSEQVQEIDTSAKFGAAYGAELREGLYLEAGADYHESHSEQPPATIDTPTLTPRVTLVKEFGTGKARPFAAVEILDMIEFPHIQIGAPFNVDEKEDPVYTFGVGFGGGARFELSDRSSIDARVMYRRLMGSENVEGVVDASVAFNF